MALTSQVEELFSPRPRHQRPVNLGQAGAFNFFTVPAALRFLRDGRTRVRPDLVVVGFGEVCRL